LKKASVLQKTALSNISSDSLVTESMVEKKAAEKAYYTDSTDSLSDTFSSNASDSGSENLSAPIMHSKDD
jgi:hypothetical protein